MNMFCCISCHAIFRFFEELFFFIKRWMIWFERLSWCFWSRVKCNSPQDQHILGLHWASPGTFEWLKVNSRNISFVYNGLATTDINKVQNFHLGRGARHGDGESVLGLAPRLLRRRRAQRRLPNLQWGGLRGPVEQTVGHARTLSSSHHRHHHLYL